MKRKNLFDDDVAEQEAPAQLNINEDYAKRFEHNKKRAERHRLEEKYKSKQDDQSDSEASGNSSDSDSETEDEDAVLATEELDHEISAALNAIKQKDPKIYDKNVEFYKPFNPDDLAKGQKAEKPVYLRDYHRERYLAGDTGADEDKESADVPKTFVEEQQALKDALLHGINAAGGDDDDDEDNDGGEFLQAKTAPAKKSTENGIHTSRAQQVAKTELDPKLADTNPELFLSNYMSSRAWAESNDNNWEAFESDEGEGNDDLDEFETAFNHRFENPAKSNETLKSYSRTITDARSVRNNAGTVRARQREAEKERKEAEKATRREEKARLKKLKLEEAEDQLRRIRSAAGMHGKELKEEEWLELLESAWENDKWEEEMSKRFGEKYYAQADDDLEEPGTSDGAKHSKVKKPKWEDDIDITDLVPEFDEDDKPQISLSDVDEDVEDGADDEDVEDTEAPSKKRKITADHKKDRIAAKQAAKKERAKLEAIVDTQMELHDPSALEKKTKRDIVAAERVVPFRYRESSPTSFGMTARDILLAPSDAALNEYAGIKKLASFRDQERKTKDKKRLGKKARLREWRRENFGPQYEHTGPTFGLSAAAEDGEDGDTAENGRSGQGQDVADGIVDGERKKKRRRSKGKKKDDLVVAS